MTQDEYDASRVAIERREYAAGFKAGLEAAAKVCEQVDGFGEYPGRWDYIAAIRALSPPPSATVQPQPNALPRPEE